MKLTNETISYLKSQLQNIDTFSRYSPTIVVRNGEDATSTNHLALNSETATLLIIWLATRFELNEILRGVAYNIVHEEEEEEINQNEDEDNESTSPYEWTIERRVQRFAEITELFK